MTCRDRGWRRRRLARRLKVRRRPPIMRLPPARCGTRSPCRTAEHGLSLLELPASLVVLGLPLVALTQGVRVGVRAWAIEGRMGGSGTDLALIDHTLRAQLARCLAQPRRPMARQTSSATRAR